MSVDSARLAIWVKRLEWVGRRPADDDDFEDLVDLREEIDLAWVEAVREEARRA